MKCNRDEDCLPAKQKASGKATKLTFMALVRPTNRSEWAAVPGFDLRPFEGEDREAIQ